MKNYSECTREELQQEKELLLKKYKEYQDLHLNLNMARGKPGADQLALSMPMLDVLNSTSDCHDKYGTDARNYGERAVRRTDGHPTRRDHRRRIFLPHLHVRLRGESHAAGRSRIRKALVQVR